MGIHTHTHTQLDRQIDRWMERERERQRRKGQTKNTRCNVLFHMYYDGMYSVLQITQKFSIHCRGYDVNIKDNGGKNSKCPSQVTTMVLLSYCWY